MRLTTTQKNEWPTYIQPQVGGHRAEIYGTPAEEKNRKEAPHLE